MHFTRGKLKGEIRAAFCDSFELEGNNWTPGMFAEFEKRMGYSLYPFLPYVFQRTGAMGEPVREAYGCSFSPEVTRDVIERVRHDFWHVQMQLFKENFIDVYNAWCHRNGLKSRIQAYGHQLHPIETSMYLDIPECESWIHDGIGRVMEPNQYLSGRGYSMVNKFVASGAFLANRNIVSCEEQTNVGNIFQTTLEEVKVTGDRSNLSGVNHSVLHGFNYSPEGFLRLDTVRYLFQREQYVVALCASVDGLQGACLRPFAEQRLSGRHRHPAAARRPLVDPRHAA